MVYDLKCPPCLLPSEGKEPPGEIIKDAIFKVAINCVLRKAHPLLVILSRKGELRVMELWLRGQCESSFMRSKTQTQRTKNIRVLWWGRSGANFLQAKYVPRDRSDCLTLDFTVAWGLSLGCFFKMPYIHGGFGQTCLPSSLWEPSMWLRPLISPCKLPHFPPLSSSQWDLQRFPPNVLHPRQILRGVFLHLHPAPEQDVEGNEGNFWRLQQGKVNQQGRGSSFLRPQGSPTSASFFSSHTCMDTSCVLMVLSSLQGWA